MSSCRRLLVAVLLGVGLTAGALRAADAPVAPLETYYLLVFNQPVAGLEAQYNAWYDQQHAPDVVSVPGFVRAQRYVLAADQLRSAPSKPKYLVIYQIKTSDLAGVYAEVRRRLASGETQISPALDRDSGQNYTYKVFRPRLAGTQPDEQLGDRATIQSFIQLVFADPATGKESEFNNWYDAHQAPEVLKAPGFTSGQRLALADVQLAPQAGERAQYLTMYEIQTKNLSRTIAGFQQLAPGMSSSPAFDDKKVAGYTYQALGPPLSGDMVRAARAAQRPKSQE
jgi:hypothetical protein